MTRKQIRSKVAYWQKELGLSNWSFSLKFERIVDHRGKTDYDRVADTSCSSEYKDAMIRFNTSSLDEIDDVIIVHELIHSLNSPLIAYVTANSKNTKPSFKRWVHYFDEQIISETARIIVRAKRG